MNLPIVVLDACVLIPMPLCDTLLRAAEKGLYRFYTSPKILEETTKNLAKIFIKQKKFDLDVAKQKAEKRINQIKRAFPEALVEPSESLIESLENDPKDRHVLAAAIEAQKLENNTTVIIVTDNLKDFPNLELSKYNVKAMSPDDFLLKLIEIQDRTENLFNLLIEQSEQRHQGEILNLLYLLEKNGKIKEFVRLILVEYFLEEIFKNVCPMIKKIGKITDGRKFLKIGEYKMYLDGQNILIESITKSCLIKSTCSSMIESIVSTKDVQRLQYLIQESQKIIHIQSRL